MPAPDDQPRQRPKRSFARRWIPRFIVAIATLIVVVVIITQIVLSTEIPKQIVIAQVQSILGLRITAGSLSTGWLGHTTLHDVQVSLPLAEKPFCTLPELHVTHTELPILLLTQSIDIHSIELDKPVVTVTQDKFGHWNLQDVAQLLLKATGQGQPPAPGKAAPLVLPDVTLRDGDIEVTDNAGRHAALTPLMLTARTQGGLVWHYDASLKSADGANASFTGRIVPNDNFTHEVDFQLNHLATLAKPWVPDFDPAAAVSGDWKGSVPNGGIAGRLTLREAQYQNITAENGDFSVQSANGSVTVTPNTLLVRSNVGPSISLHVAGGSIQADASRAKINQLDLTALDGDVRLDGALSYADLTGSLKASWSTLHPARGIDTTGTFTASMQPQWPDRYAITAQLTTAGSALALPYSADIALTAAGKNWNAAEATITARTLRYDWKTPIRLDGLVAHIASNPGQIQLTDVSIARLNSSNGTTGGSVIGSGALKYDPTHPGTDHYNWWLYLAGENLTIPAIPNSPITPPTIAGAFNAWGDQQNIGLKNSYAVLGSVLATADGYYHISSPKPMDVNVFVAETTKSPSTMPAADSTFVQGHLRGDAHLTGTIAPLDLLIDGQLHGRGLIIAGSPLDDVDLKCTAEIDKNHAVFDTDQLKLLDGEWKLHAQMPGAHQVPEAKLTFHDLKLASVGALVHQPNISGSASGMLDGELNEPSFDHLAVNGQFSATDVHANQLLVDEATGSISLRQNRLAITPIHLTHGGGHAEASLAADLAHPELITAKLNAEKWPADVGQIHAELGANTRQLLIDAKNRTASGRVGFSGGIDFQSNHVGDGAGTVALTGQTANLESFSATALGGTADGTATFALAAPMASRAEFHWKGLNFNALSSYEDRLRGAGGSFSGQAVLAPVSDPRALAPLLLTIDAAGTHTHMGPVQLAGFHLPLWLDKDPEYRAVLDGGRINIADGSIGVFARLSSHVDNTLTAQLNATLSELDVDQLINEVEMSSTPTTKSSSNPESTPTTHNQKSAYPGRLNGQIDANGDPRNVKACFANIALSLHDSDLANFGPFAALYNVMHLGGGPSTPSGAGTVNARYDNDDFIVTSLYYFNRGIYAYGDPRVNDIRKYPDCPQSGSVAGTFRPLENIKLPFFADADQIFSVLQSNFSAIALGGTVGKPTYTPQSVADLGSALKNVLIGNAQSK